MADGSPEGVLHIRGLALTFARSKVWRKPELDAAFQPELAIRAVNGNAVNELTRNYQSGF